MPQDITITLNDKQVETIQTFLDQYNAENPTNQITFKKLFNNLVDPMLRSHRVQLKQADVVMVSNAVVDATANQLSQIKTILGI